jgi:multimeric flavodoxin WrbA
LATRILGIVGSYRKGGIIDSLVSETLAAAEGQGAATAKVHLVDMHIEFCTNCRTCTQQPGPGRGKCIHNDDMEGILAQWEESDALVLGAPVNFFNVNAITRRFMERLLGYAYWPWDEPAGPHLRTKAGTKRAVLITSSAMPAMMGRVFTGALRALRLTAAAMGAKPVASIFVGTSAVHRQQAPPEKALRKARNAGRKLAAG